MKLRYFNIFVFFIILALHIVTYSQTKNLDMSCVHSEDKFLTMAFGVEYTRLNELLEIDTKIQLIDSNIIPINMGIFAFINGKQIDTSNFNQALGCNDTAQFKFTLPFQESQNNVVHLFTRRLPDIPPQITLSTALEDYSQYAFLYSDVNTKRFSEKSLEFNPDDFSNIKSSIVKMIPNLSDGFFFVGDDPSVAEAQEYVRFIKPLHKDNSFQIYFPNSAQKKTIYAITCLQDGIQKNVFNNQAVWAGELEVGEAALISGQFEDLEETDWHQLRCLVLNDLYGDSERISESLFTIASLYIHYIHE